MKDDDIIELKKALNNAIWMYAPKSITLEQAEAAAVLALVSITEAMNEHRVSSDE